MFAKLFLATLLASASGATLGAKPAAKALRLRGGLDDTTVLKINAGALALFDEMHRFRRDGAAPPPPTAIDRIVAQLVHDLSLIHI